MEPKLQKCEGCIFFAQAGGAKKDDEGACRRHSPGGDVDGRAKWPRVLPSEGCGDGAPKK